MRSMNNALPVADAIGRYVHAVAKIQASDTAEPGAT